MLMNMKKIYTILLAFFCAPFLALAQFTPQLPGFAQATAIASISAVDDNVVWIAGRDTSQSVAGNRFARSINGGANWNQFVITGFNTYTPSNICAINRDTAWVSMFNSTGGGGIFRTNNGGTTWTHQTTATFTNGFPNFVHFFNANNGVAMGDPNGGYFEIYTTTNGGTNWTRVAQSLIPARKTQEYGTVDIYQASGNTIYFISNYGRLFYSTNQGNNWSVATEAFKGDSVFFNWISPTSATHALAKLTNFANTKSYFVETNNSGQTWNEIKYVQGDAGVRSKTLYLPLAATEGIHLTQSPGSITFSFDQGRSWKNPTNASFFGNAASYAMSASASGSAWIGGNYLSPFSPGLVKYQKPATDIMAIRAQIGGGKTNCFNRDSMEIKIINSGSSAINFATNPATINFNVYGRIPGDPNISGPTTLTENINLGTLNPGEILVKKWTGGALNANQYEIWLQADVRLSNTASGTDWNDTTGLVYFNGPRVVSLRNTTTNLYTNTAFRGETLELRCSGEFSSIQWQSQLPFDTTWTNISGATSATYTFQATQSQLFRAITCGNQPTDPFTLFISETGNVVGYTYFDNQTNASNANRVEIYNNKVFTTFTGSWDSSFTAFSDRGMFYNQLSGGKWDSIPKKRIESVRTGFGALAVTKTGKEIIVSHNAATQKLVVSRRNVAGTGAWTEQIDVLKGMWPRIICSGGDTVHVICMDTGISANAKIRYYRSPNAGQTWDIQTDLPGYDAASGFATTNAETYTIDAYRNVVAIVAGGYNNRLVLWKSTNRGSTWTQKVIKTFPSGFDGSFVLSPTETTDGAASASVDGSGKVHVVTGGMMIEDNTSGDNNWNWFPGTDRLLYWNDALATDSLNVIASNDRANVVNGGTNYFGTAPMVHPLGRASMANISAHRSTGNLYVTFNGPTNNSSTENHGIDKRDIYGLMSPNNGLVWSEPMILSIANGGVNNTLDHINPSIGNDQVNTIHMVWQTSPTVMKITGAADGIRTMIHDAFNYNRFQSITELSVSSSACSGDSIQIAYKSVGAFAQINVQLSDNKGSFASPTLIATVPNLNNSNQLKVRLPLNVNNGNYRIRLVSTDGTISRFSAISISRKPNKPVVTNLRPLTFCSGDSTVLSVDTAQIGVNSHYWQVDGLTDFTSYQKLKYAVNNTATVRVLVDNGGCNATSDPVNVVRNSNQAITVALTPDTVVCEGSPVTLRATVLTGTPTTYQWKFNGSPVGTNTNTLPLGNATGSMGGKYTIDISSQCGTYNSDTIDLTVGFTPAITSQPANVVSCVGGSAVFKAKSNSNAPVTYEWKKGTSTVSFSDSLVLNNVALSDTGSYHCTITNQCGSVTSASATLSIGNPVAISGTLSDTSVCGGSSITFSVTTSGSSPSFEWLKNGIPLATSQQLALSNVQPSDSGFYAVRVYNGCNSVVSNAAKLTVKEAATGSISRSGDSLVLAINGTAGSFEWYVNGNLISGATTLKIPGTVSGDYHVRITSPNGCVYNTPTFTFVRTGISTQDAFTRLNVYPNPASSELHVDYLPPHTQLKMIDAQGKVVIQRMLNEPNTAIPVAHLSEGIYMIWLDSGTSSKTIRIQITH